MPSGAAESGVPVSTGESVLSLLSGCCCFPCGVGSSLVAGKLTSASQPIPTEREPEYPGQDIEVGRVPLGDGSRTDCTKCSSATPPVTLNASESDLSI